MMGAQGSSLAAALLLAGARATPTPPPGPNCVGNNVPIANTSGLEPDCPALLEPHNASCANVHKYTDDPQFHPMDSATAASVLSPATPSFSPRGNRSLSSFFLRNRPD